MAAWDIRRDDESHITGFGINTEIAVEFKLENGRPAHVQTVVHILNVHHSLVRALIAIMREHETHPNELCHCDATARDALAGAMTLAETSATMTRQ